LLVLSFFELIVSIDNLFFDCFSIFSKKIVPDQSLSVEGIPATSPALNHHTLRVALSPLLQLAKFTFKSHQAFHKLQILLSFTIAGQ
jgi:hypothetical protein